MSEKGGFFFNTLTGNLKWNSRVSEEVVANKMHITRLISYKLRLTGAQQNNLPGPAFYYYPPPSWPLNPNQVVVTHFQGPEHSLSYLSASTMMSDLVKTISPAATKGGNGLERGKNWY